ncbi:MAG: phosphoenolpyruvate synthase, partial [Cytophagales bacterium]|nr:phosphoenolpyruvate synthase [Cytophagales bacterium]
MKNRNACVLGFGELDQTKLARVGGKGANLGELSRIEGVQVPEGFCVTTDAYQEIVGNCEAFNVLLSALAPLKADQREGIRETTANIRKVIEALAIPQALDDQITRHLQQLGEGNAFAVRSSATAEDLPTASFAGQQDTYLNVIGKESVLKHVGKCWASLFTERAVTYRLQNGFDHRKVHLAVVVQRMVFPEAAGILFTADPVTGNRKVLSIDAGFGLGEALVAGLVNADHYKVRDGKVIDKQVAAKGLAVYAARDGGTATREVEPARQGRQVLTEEQMLRLARLGSRIEAHFGGPQDIEWCLADDAFYIVQSRPITTLYPIPEANDGENRVYLSVGHNQMMTDPLKPLGLSFFLLTTNAPMRTAGGRLFVDVTPMLASPAGRKTLIDGFGKADPLTKDALVTIAARADFVQPSPADPQEPAPGTSNGGVSPAGVPVPVDPGPALVADLIRRSQTSVEALKQNIGTKRGADLFDFILEDIGQLKKILFDPQSAAVIRAAMEAAAWINEKMHEWLGEKNAADTLSQSVAHNITSEMGLALLDVADVIRPHPEVIAYLQRANEDTFLEELVRWEGGQQARDAICA